MNRPRSPSRPQPAGAVVSSAAPLASTAWGKPIEPWPRPWPETKPRRPSTSHGWAETALQRAIGRLLDIYETQGKLLWWPVPNGSFIAGRDAEERAKRVAKMKADCMLRPGVADLGILFAHNRLIFAELKVGKNDLTPAQIVFREKVLAMGGWFYVWRDVDTAQVDLRRWL